MDFFPPLTLWDTKSLHESSANWLALHLRVMEEKPIFNIELEAPNMVMRFLWFRTFHQPVVIRAEINQEGMSVLHTKITDGNGAYRAGKLIYSERNKLSAAQISTINTYLIEMDYWNMEPFTPEIWLDGAEWIVEIRTGDTYKLVKRTSPRTGFYRELGLYLLEIANVTVENIY